LNDGNQRRRIVRDLQLEYGNIGYVVTNGEFSEDGGVVYVKNYLLK